MSTERVTIAVLGKPRGVRGEIKAFGHSSKPERFDALDRVFLSGHEQPFEVEEVWEHQGIYVFKFAGVNSIDQAAPFQGCEVQIPMEERVALDEGEYFDSDIVGCDVIDQATGKSLGKVTALQDGGGSGLLAIGEDLLIPFTTGICVSIDVEKRRIVANIPEGLLEVNSE